MFGRKPDFVPEEDRAWYRFMSLALYLLFFAGLILGLLSFLFPYSRYTFDFNNPDATKNTVFAPHSESFVPIRDGKVAPQDELVFYVNNWHILESGKVRLWPSERSRKTVDLNGQPVRVRHGWAATFSPQAETPLEVPDREIVEFEGSYYELRDNTLFPFVSARAAKTHIPEEQIRTVSPVEFSRLPQSDELQGFRAGTLIAYADGVFVVTEDGLIRPFGSPKILLRLGYTFNHVIPAGGEEAGIYTRGKIILPGQLHPSGTLFQDQESGRFFLYEKNTLSPLTTSYSDFLKKTNDVVSFSLKESKEASSCSLKKDLWQQSYSCELPINFSEGLGDDYQITITNGADYLDVARVTAGLQASRKSENARAVAVLLANRILERFGIERE